jgi:hypothetical protein
MAFVCQQCKQPLQVRPPRISWPHVPTLATKLDASLVDLAPSAYDMIVGSLPPLISPPPPPPDDAERLAQLSASPTMKAAWRAAAEATGAPARTTLSPRAAGKQPISPHNGAIATATAAAAAAAANTTPARPTPGAHESFVVLQDALGPPLALSHRLRSTQRLLGLLAGRTDVDHPLCSECTHTLLATLARQLDETKKERDGYIAFEKEVRREKERERDGVGKDEAERRIRELDEEERVAVEQLRAAERERAQLEEEMRALELEEKALEEEEEECVSVLLSRSSLPCACAERDAQVLARAQRATPQSIRTGVAAGRVARRVRRRLGDARTSRAHKCLQRRVLHRPRRPIRNDQQPAARQGSGCAGAAPLPLPPLSFCAHTCPFPSPGRVGRGQRGVGPDPAVAVHHRTQTRFYI